MGVETTTSMKATWHDLALVPGKDQIDFAPGPPTFAVEVRSKGNHGKTAEAAMAARRFDFTDRASNGA
jgi:hypothetical protein